MIEILDVDADRQRGDRKQRRIAAVRNVEVPRYTDKLGLPEFAVGKRSCCALR